MCVKQPIAWEKHILAPKYTSWGEGAEKDPSSRQIGKYMDTQGAGLEKNKQVV